MENLMECSICLEKYNQKDKLPRILLCGHTFCTSCLKKIKENSNEDKIKCPLDLKLGFETNNIENIPINRLMVDLLDLKDDTNNKNNNLNYVVKTKEKLEKLYNLYDYSRRQITDALSYLLISTEKCENSISSYYSTLMLKLQNKKDFLINLLNNYANDKNTYYNHLLVKLETLNKAIQNKLAKIEIAIQLKKKSNFSEDEEKEFINSLDLLMLEDNDLIKQLNYVLNEIKAGYNPQILYDRNENIELLAEIVINYLSLNIENNNSYSNYQYNINSKIRDINNNSESNNEIKNNLNGNEILNNNQLKQLSLSFKNINLKEEITKLLWFKQGDSKIFTYDLIADNNWEEIKNDDNFEIPYSLSITQLSNESAFITGGCYSDKKVIKKCFLYNNKKFYEKNDMINERRNHSSIRIDNNIYVVGGMDNYFNHLRHCEKYSMINEKWSKCASLNIEKSHLSLCNIDNKYIFAFGGENKIDGILNTIEKYCVVGDVWEIINIKLPYQLECVGCIGISNREILIFGGFCPQKMFNRNTIIKYNILNQQINFSSRQLNNNIGWSIYMPIKIGNRINVFLGGDQEQMPIIEKFDLL